MADFTIDQFLRCWPLCLEFGDDLALFFRLDHACLKTVRTGQFHGFTAPRLRCPLRLVFGCSFTGHLCFRVGSSSCHPRMSSPQSGHKRHLPVSGFSLLIVSKEGGEAVAAASFADASPSVLSLPTLNTLRVTGESQFWPSGITVWAPPVTV